jgi:hypothetical protein
MNILGGRDRSCTRPLEIIMARSQNVRPLTLHGRGSETQNAETQERRAAETSR